MTDTPHYHYLNPDDDAPQPIHAAFTEDETRRIFAIAEHFAARCKARGIEPPPDPLRALLAAAEGFAPEGAFALDQLHKRREATRTSARHRRQALADAGLCPDCGTAAADAGYRTCGPCREQARVKTAAGRLGKVVDHAHLRKQDDARRARVKAEGRCYICRRAPADEGRPTCAPCRKARAEYARARRRANTAPA